MIALKLLHTFIWGILCACILAIPIAAATNHFTSAALLSGITLLECAVLALNRGRCPLTTLAARYTNRREANFDIYLPLWLARFNKIIFGSLFVAGALYALIRWQLSLR